MKTKSKRLSRTRRDLPPLEALDRRTTDSESKTARLLKLLRQTVTKSRRQGGQPFYSVRHVAHRFGVSPATVSRVYRHLNAERVLRLMWGRRTVIEPRASRRATRNVAILVDLQRFAQAPEYREDVLGTQNELWSHRARVEFIFYRRPRDVISPLKRYLTRCVDTLIWVAPEPAAHRAIHASRMTAARVICIGSEHIAGIPESFSVSKACAPAKILRKHVFDA